MSRWFRWYEGTSEDGKFRVVARLSRVTVRDVIALWAFMLEDAAHLDHRGVCKRDEDFMSAILDFDDGVVERILEAMESAAMISVGHGDITICNWGKRQFEGDADPTAAERQRRKRERDKAVSNEPVTRDSRPPETETETETETEKNRVLSHPCEEARNLWNEAAENLSLSKAQVLNATRKASLRKRLQELGGIEGWRAMLEIIGKSPHLLGDNDRGWKATFDWILKPANLTKVMEGNYVRAKANRPNSIAAGFDAIRASLESRSDQGDPRGPEDPFGLPGLRQSA